MDKEQDLNEKRCALVDLLYKFDILAEIEHVYVGPSLYLFQLNVFSATKVQKIKQLTEDLGVAMKDPGVRVLIPIVGTNRIGIEVNRANVQVVSFQDSLPVLCEYINKHKSIGKIPVVIGKDTRGLDVIVDITSMPHLIIGGTTGSGKSVCVNVFISSIISTQTPSKVRLLLIDPKKVEMSLYDRVPHLLCSVITDMSNMVVALEWLIKEMDRRYDLLKLYNVRSLDELCQQIHKNSSSKLHKGDLYKIVCIIDEFADLIILDKEKVESSITKLSRLSRAVGIHLVLATQRPSKDVLTGRIKANFPARIAFRVANKTNSLIIIDDVVAAYLKGHGDMLIDIPGADIHKQRVQGCLISEQEIHNVVNRVIGMYGALSVPKIIFEDQSTSKHKTSIYLEAVKIVQDNGYGAASLLQRKLKIGYYRASNLLHELIDNKIIQSKKNQNRVHDLLDYE